MKKLILFILLIISTICFATDFPEVKFNSVGTYNFGTNYVPNITPAGATQIYTTNKVYTPKRTPGKEDGNDPGDPFTTPIGEIPSVSVFLFASAYILCKRNKP